MNVFELELDQFHEAQMIVQMMVNYNDQALTVKGMSRYIHWILYENQRVTSFHKTILFLLYQKGYDVNAFENGLQPLFFKCGSCTFHLHEFPNKQAFDLLCFLVEQCGANVHQTDGYGRSFLFHVGQNVTNYNQLDEKHLQTIQKIIIYVLEKGSWKEHQGQLKHYLSILLYNSLFKQSQSKFFRITKKVFCFLLPHCLECTVQEATLGMFFNMERMQYSKKILKVIFQYGFLLSWKKNSLVDKAINMNHEGEICIFYSIFI